MGKFKNIAGQKFGRLTAVRATEERKQGAVVWECLCICGKTAYVSRPKLEQGHTLSCGCLQAENVSMRNKLRQTKDITGQKFGRLTAIRATENRDNGYVVWECTCDCGNKGSYVNTHNLINGNTASCGCLAKELAKENAPKNLCKYLEENYIEGTRLDFLDSNKINKNNTTGFKGVYLRKKDGKYISKIYFKNKRYFLGSYETKEEAYSARLLAEKELHGEFLKWYKAKFKNK